MKTLSLGGTPPCKRITMDCSSQCRWFWLAQSLTVPMPLLMKQLNNTSLEQNPQEMPQSEQEVTLLINSKLNEDVSYLQITTINTAPSGCSGLQTTRPTVCLIPIPRSQSNKPSKPWFKCFHLTLYSQRPFHSLQLEYWCFSMSGFLCQPCLYAS